MRLAAAQTRLRAALRGEVRLEEPMARHTTLRIGGPAAVYAVLDTVSEVAAALTVLAEEAVPWTVVGKGSNLLVSDAGYRGAVLVLGREFKRHSVDGATIVSGAGAPLAALVQEAFQRGLAGMTWGVGIPGTLGGAIVMNAGTADGSIGPSVDTVTVYVPGEGLRMVHGPAIEWGYRTCSLAGTGIILESNLKVVPGERARIRAEMERALARRKTTQPISSPSAGSVFRNPEGGSAGRLIEEAGLKGLRLGGARVSDVHANFIVNEGGATAADVMGLMRKIIRSVRDRDGIELEPEVRFLGEFGEA
jgi:UDP-N-acetylmuramate dehydrogenase